MPRKHAKAAPCSINDLVGHFIAKRSLVAGFLTQVLGHIQESDQLKPFIHSIKSRVKDPEHLREKLNRKFKSARMSGRELRLTKESLFTKINDLAGLRILHLHTHQISQIDPRLREIFDEQNFKLIEGPFARTWDDEYRDYFSSINITPQKSQRMYTSVHYVIGSGSKTKITCEVQVRTLMEEVWGEVDHSLNYPKPTDSVACSEQIRALARLTSSATRLVDSIFTSNAEHQKHHAHNAPAASKKRNSLAKRKRIKK